MSTDSALSLGQLPLRPTSDGAHAGPLPQTPTGSSFKSANPFSSKVTAVLATSYADSEFRDALSLLDERGITNSAATRRQLRLRLQKEVIDSNGDVIAEFGKVSDVSSPSTHVPQSPYLTAPFSNYAALEQPSPS